MNRETLREMETSNLRAENSKLREDRRKLVEALQRAAEADGYESHEDTVGYRICCQVASYMPHKKDCYIASLLLSLGEKLGS